MENIEIISMAGLVFPLIIGLVLYFVFKKKKTQISDINNMKSNDNKSISRPLNKYINVVNSTKTHGPNQIGSDICQETHSQDTDSDLQPSYVKIFKDDIKRCKYEDDDLLKFIVKFHDFLLVNEMRLVKYYEYRSTEEFKKYITRVDEKINLKKVFSELFEKNPDQLKYFDKILATIREGLDIDDLFNGTRNIFEEDEEINNIIIAEVIRKIRENISSEFDPQAFEDIIKEKEEIFGRCLNSLEFERLLCYLVRIPYIKEKDTIDFKKYAELLFDMMDDIVKVIGFCDIFHIFLLQPFQNLEYSTDLCQLIEIKQNLIFYFNRAVFDPFYRLLRYTESYDAPNPEKDAIISYENRGCVSFYCLNEKAIRTGRIDHVYAFKACFYHSITRYLAILCYILFSCDDNDKMNNKTDYIKVVNSSESQNGSFNSKNFNKINGKIFKLYTDQIFTVFSLGLKLFYHVINPNNEINDEYITKLKTYIYEIGMHADHNILIRKIFTTFFEFE